MPIRHQRNCLVALRANDLEQLPQLILCEAVNSARLRRSDALSGVRADGGCCIPTTV